MFWMRDTERLTRTIGVEDSGGTSTTCTGGSCNPVAPIGSDVDSVLFLWESAQFRVSKGGLEPPRPYERQPLKLVRLPISPLRRGFISYIDAFSAPTTAPKLLTPSLFGQKKSKSNNGEQPDQRDHGGNTVEVALCCRRTETCATSAAEHVGQAATLTAVQQNRCNEGEHCHYVNNDGEDSDDVTHGSRA
jgi:hypothetical protein